MDKSDKLSIIIPRTDITLPFEEVIREIEKSYPSIGKIESYEPIVEGYEDANIKLQTNTGTFILKLFSAKKTPENAISYTKLLLEAHTLDIPVPKLVEGINGYLQYITNEHSRTPYFLTRFFDGQNFQNRTPSLIDMITIVHYISLLNTLNFPVASSYDSWGNKNIVAEYDKHKDKVASDKRKLIEEVVEQVRALDFTRFQKGVIHGDMQRKHVLKNKSEQYCLLDFGCMANDAIVIDISTYLAWFCLAEDTWDRRDEIIRLVLKEYGKQHTLSDYELHAIPLLIRAAYAAYFFKTSILINNGDMSDETNEWHEAAERMLRLTSEWDYTAVRNA